MNNKMIYANNQKIHMLDADVGILQSLKKEILQFNCCALICNCIFYLTTNEAKVIEYIKKYYDEENIIKETGPVIFVKIKLTQNIKEPEKIFLIDEVNGIYKYSWKENFLYKGYGNILCINKSFQYAELQTNSIENFIQFLPYLIKNIEAMVIKTEIKLGFYPLHAALIEKNKNIILIMADSQCGKTSLARQEIDEYQGRFLSDDIVFLDTERKVAPFGKYKKESCAEYQDYCEIIKSRRKIYYREINKLNEKFTWYTFSKIYFPQITCGISKIEYEKIENREEKIQKIYYGMKNYPNTWFLEEKENRLRAFDMATNLCKKDVYNVRIPFRKEEKE